MPEGPEIRLAADKIEAALHDRELIEVFFAFDHLKPYSRSLAGSKVLAVETRGKALLINMNCGLSIYSHNQLYGRWMIRKAGNMPKTSRQLRLALHNHDYSAYLFSASDISVIATGQQAQHPFLARLGPDIMSASLADVRRQIKALRFSRRRLGQLLLDQSYLAGMGNYLRSESLHVAGIHPDRRPTDCGAEELDRLASSILKLARQSYRQRGITNDMVRARALKAEGRRRSEYRHWVFAREGRPCYRCGEKVIKTRVASRRLYYCPRCQA